MVSFLILNSSLFAQLNKAESKKIIESTLSKHFQNDQPGVTVLVAKNGKILYKGAVGMANLELNVPMQVDHVLRIGSITKQFTAVAILMLEEKGKLSVKDDITKFLPSYPTLGKKITIEHLLTHTSGIRSYTSLPDFMDNLRNDMKPSEMVDLFKDKQMIFEPGEEHSYNNSGYFLLGMIIEEASGMTYEDFIENNIFNKVGMKNSYYGNANQIIPNRASGYELENGEIINAPYLSMTIPYAAGSLLSTVEDLFKWNQALHTGKIISKKSLEKAHTPYVLKNGEKTNYGFGWGLHNFYGSKTIQHSGGINGFVSNAMYLPDEDLFIAAFSNGKDPSFFTQIAIAKLLGKYPTDMAKKSLSKEQLADYVGVYQVENSKHQRTIRIKDDHLTSIRTGGELHYLYAFEKDKFYFDDALEIFEFKRDKTGKVRGIIAHLSNGKTGRAIKTDEILKEQEEIKLDSGTLQRYAGKYEIEPGFYLEFTIEKENFWVQPTGDSKLQVYAKGQNKFFLKDIDAQLEFFEQGGEFSEVRVNLGGQRHVGKRKK